MTTTLGVELTNEDGSTAGRVIPVTIEYRVLVDKSYGADADGNRGEWREELEFLSHDINWCYLQTLNSLQVERLIKDAQAIIHNRWQQGAL